MNHTFKSDSDEPIKPTVGQRRRSKRWGWSYDRASFLFTKGEVIGYFTKNGFIKI